VGRLSQQFQHSHTQEHRASGEDDTAPHKKAYKVHDDATLLPIELESRTYGFEGKPIPALNASASRDEQGRIHITLCNLDPKKKAVVTCRIQGAEASRVAGRALTADTITAHNTFERPDKVHPVPFDGAKLSRGTLSITLPPRSVTAIEVF
jgi:alpha-N-arabinofuranosidase